MIFTVVKNQSSVLEDTRIWFCCCQILKLHWEKQNTNILQSVTWNLPFSKSSYVILGHPLQQSNPIYVLPEKHWKVDLAAVPVTAAVPKPRVQQCQGCSCTLGHDCLSIKLSQGSLAQFWHVPTIIFSCTPRHSLRAGTVSSPMGMFCRLRDF